jgi:hypothetical protein
LIGEALRGGKHALLRKGFESRVNLAIDGELVPASVPAMSTRSPRWWRPFAGAAVVVGVAVVAISAMQQRSSLVAGSPGALLARSAGSGLPDGDRLAGTSNHEALSYTVPAASNEVPVARPSGRLTNYMFAHSKYSYGLGQRGVLADLLINEDEPAGPAREPAAKVPVRAAP